MTFTPIVAMKFVNSDGSNFIVKEGDLLDKIVYKEDGQYKTLTGVCRVISVSTRTYADGPSTCPPDPFFTKIARVNNLIIDISTNYDAKLKTISINDLVSVIIRDESAVFVDLVNIEDSSESIIADTINNADESVAIVLSEGSVSETLEITKNVTIEGTNSGVPQNYAQEV